MLAAALCAGGCSRAFYRQQADGQANCLIDQKATLVGVEPGELRIDIDPRSRMFGEERPDCPPMPPDDPIAHKYLECVDCKRGSKLNADAARTPFVENPNWLAFLPRDDAGRLTLDLTAAVDVALLHSPDYQQQLEELYLSALDVSFERFRFDCQFFGGSSIFYTADGRVRSGTGASSSLLEVSPSNPTSRLRVEKLTATGGEIVAGFANSLVWQFSGSDNYTSTTLLDFTVLQPLLRTGGRAVVLESLTFTERALLANVRSMERFRRGFYLSIAIGEAPGPGPVARGFSPFGAPIPGDPAAGGIGIGPTGGYLGLLQQAQELRNEQANVTALRASVDQLEALFDAGRIDPFQVDLARQALLNGQGRLLTAQAGLQSSTDAFLIDLGLPPDVEVRLTDTMLDSFQLRRPELTNLQAEAADLATELRTAALSPADGAAAPGDEGAEVIPPGPQLAPEPIPAPDAAAVAAEQVAEPATPEVERQLDLARRTREQLASVEEDFQRLLEAVPSRREHLTQLRTREEVGSAQIDPAILSPQRLDDRIAQLRTDLDAVAERISQVVASIEAAPLAADGEEAAPTLVRRRTETLSTLLLELSLLQARARLDTVEIEPTNLSDADALVIALLHRRDLKNARSALVDAWRLINYNANDLLSDLDLTFSGDLGNVGDNPFRLRDTNGRLSVGLEFDGPLNRLIERNTYRETLINYQRARRDFYQYIDVVNQDLRATLRQIRLNEVNLELSREAVLVAIAQVEITQLRLSEPPKPGVEQQASNTTARDLVDALANLLSVQNAFLAVWVNNQSALLTLEFDLGLMQLDSMGQRIPLAMPLKDFVDAIQCPTEGGPERLPGDIEPVPPTRFDPLEPPQELRFPDRLTAQRRTDPTLRPVSHTADSPVLRRLPRVE